ncbi:MAG TPA: TolC family protein, partial [Chitinophagales bacterium]|nr:TolC family protein [Chitinophagales bacterium]
MKQIFVIAFAFWSTFITAQETMSLKDCVNYALKNHTSISMAKNDLESAVARKNEGRSAYLPQVNAQISWDDNIIKQSTMMPAFPPLTTEPMKLEIGPKFNTIAGIQLDQTIFNMSYIEGIRALKPNEELNKLKLQKTEEDVIYNTVAAYYQLLIINENEKLLNESEVRINKTLPIVQLQYDKGVARKIDV